MVKCPKKDIEDFICEILTGGTQKSALDFIAHCRTNGLAFERHNEGWWEGKLYWWVKYNDETVFYILVYSPASAVDSAEPWVVWSDDSGSKWFEDYPLDEHLKEIAWKNVGVCGNEIETACDGCPGIGGQPKTIFGKIFGNTCGTTFRFNNPNGMELECLKKLVEIRKKDIIKNS